MKTLTNKTESSMLNWFTYFIVVLVVSGAINIFAQGKNPPTVPQIFYSGSFGDGNNPMPTPVKPETSVKSAKEKALESQLEAARTSGNTMTARQIQSQLDKLRGGDQVYQPNSDAFQSGKLNNNGQTDYSQSSIHSFSTYSHAIGTAPTGSPLAGRLYYMFSQDSQSGNDSLKLLQSTDNGASWSSVMYISINGYMINNDELDIEIVYNGTNTYLFGVMGLTDPNGSKRRVFFFRYNLTTNSYYGTVLNFPGSGNDMHYYNPRITSDNANYTSNSYVMMICSMDSLSGASTHHSKQKYAYSSAPFDATPSINYIQPNGSYGFGWKVTGSLHYVYSDIAYYKDDGGTGENRVMTVFGLSKSGVHDILIAYTSGYNAIGSTLHVVEQNENSEVKLAFNGGSNNRYGMITYVREYNANDWDLIGIRTTNGGSTAADWTIDTIDYSSDRSRNADLVAVRNGNNQFRLCYSQENSNIPAAYYRSYNGSWSPKYQISSNKVDTQYAKPRAGYILGGGDDGACVWSDYNGYNGYFAKQIVTTTGISTNNEIPSGFSLAQNYPNPFNPVTNIKFSIPNTGLVTLKVYDITGKEVAALVNQNMNAGSYTFDFDASHLATGAYFYRLSADGFTDVKKMMLIK